MSMRLVRINVPDLQLPDNRVSNTRYTRWNFLFKTLAQQFSKPMNRYFLLIAFLQLDASLTPVNPASTWGPLIIVTLVSMMKEAIDDSKRAESDRAANERRYSVGGYGGDGAAARSVRAAEIRVGQLVCVLRDEEVPCDLVLLQTSEGPGLSAGTCYVQTTNIDGEADLKLRRALPQTQAVPRAQLHELRGTVECALPNAEINEFDSTLVLDSAAGAPRIGLSVEHLLLQATHVRKTAWVVGLAVYTGNQTKLGCNKSVPPFKYPAVEQLVNHFSVAIFVFQLVLTVALGLRGASWRLAVGKSLAYLGYAHSSRQYEPVYYVVIPLRFLLLMSLMIPISLAVTLDILRWTYARWIGADALMRDERTGARAVANSSSVPEDLGQIRYVFTDKTGTLTENQMVFRRASVGGLAYGEATDGAAAGIFADVALISKTQAGDLRVVNFWRCIALCNTCLPSPSAEWAGPGGSGLPYEYVSPSPDEEELCMAAQSFGVALAARGADGVLSLELRVPRLGSSVGSRGLPSALRCAPPAGAPGREERWTVLHELPFSSERKRMTVVARHEGSGECVVFSKGADDAMLPLLAARDASGIGARTSRHIRRFARQGLRTLLMAMRRLDAREYAELAARLRDASVATRGRSEALAAAYGAIERELEPLGASAIEDSLQPGVPETIRALREAGICVWMLTGDKAETALEVARACRLVPPGAFPVELRQLDLEESGRSDSGGLLSQPGSPPTPTLPTAAAAADGSRRGRAFGGAAAQAPAGARAESNVSVADGDGAEKPIPVLVLSGESPAEVRDCVRQHRAHVAAGVYGAREGAGVDDEVDDGAAAVAEPLYALMLAGGVLSRALDESCRADFCALALGASAVICARATPSEKARVVRLVKRATEGAAGPAVRVLAIGDGGNDVAMMQEAHVGVGLAGKEGLQAARAADYTLGRFRFLERLLLVHGRRAHARTASICLYTFYKSIFFASMQVLHNTTTGFSGASLFPSLGVTVWNAPLTMLTGFSLLFDRDVSDASLVAFPRLYAHTQRSRDLNVRVFALWWARAVAQAALCYWATLSAFGTTAYAHPATGAACELKSTGYVGYTVALYVQVLTVYAEHKSFVLWNHAASAGCLALFHLGFWLHTSLATSGDDRGLIATLYADPAYWLGSATIAVAAVLPVALVKHAAHHAWPDETEVVQYFERVHGPALPGQKEAARQATEDARIAGYRLAADV